MTNIKAVSKLAGVSVSTVSRVFTYPDKVAEPTLKRVYEAAKLLNYKPNSLARQLRSNQVNTVLVIVPDLANAFFATVLAGVERVASEAGLSLLLSDSHDDFDTERSCIEMVQTRRADGVVQFGARTLEALAGGEATKDIPFVHAIEPPGFTQSPSVSIDHALASERMVEYVLAQGHRTIGVVAGLAVSDTTKHRLEGYRTALNRVGVPYDPSLVEFAPFTVRGGEQAASRLLAKSRDITALFCMGDEMAVGAMCAARRLGYEVPREMSVTGFDNIDISAYIDPALTTVTQPGRELGEVAMRLMVDILNNRPIEERRIILPAELVIRESVTAPARRKRAS